jgi:hypothetical protein
MRTEVEEQWVAMEVERAPALPLEPPARHLPLPCQTDHGIDP